MSIHEDVRLPGSVAATDGAGDLPVLRVSAPAATAEVYLHGAHVTAWSPDGHEPVLWLSRHSRFEDGAAIRGGVPICFPWFGPGREPGTTPAHGFARLVDWTLVDVLEGASDVSLVLRLTDDDVRAHPARVHWPHRFEALYVVTVGETLNLALTVRNTGDVAYSFEEALHTYLAVGDVGSVTVEGLDGSRYLDKTTDDGELVEQEGPVAFAGETDRVYRSTATVTVDDGSDGRHVVVAKESSASTVLWNPGAAKAAAMADVGDEEWTGMVCVETANVLDDAVTLAPGQRHTLRAGISLRG